MALKPTIYKFDIALSDLNRDYYDSISLTVAQHPSETQERMMARLLAFCLNAQDRLTFTKGLSEVEEPDIWLVGLDEQVNLWIDVGEPDAERVKKSVRKSDKVRVYSFNSKSDVWWQQFEAKFARLNADFFQFNWEQIQSLAALTQRTMAMSVTITGNTAFITLGDESCEVAWHVLQEI